MNSNLNQIKTHMLNEYESNINMIFNNYFNGQISLSDCIKQINQFNKDWDFLRVDFKLDKFESNKINFMEFEKTTRVTYSKTLLDKKEYLCKLESNNHDLSFMIKCMVEDNLKICFRSKDVINNLNNPVKIVIVCYELSVNKNNIFIGDVGAHQDNPYVYEKSCENDQVLLINIKFRTIFDYFPQLKMALSKETTNNEMILYYESINKYIKNEKQNILL